MLYGVLQRCIATFMKYLMQRCNKRTFFFFFLEHWETYPNAFITNIKSVRFKSICLEENDHYMNIRHSRWKKTENWVILHLDLSPSKFHICSTLIFNIEMYPVLIMLERFSSYKVNSPVTSAKMLNLHKSVPPCENRLFNVSTYKIEEKKFISRMWVYNIRLKLQFKLQFEIRR